MSVDAATFTPIPGKLAYTVKEATKATGVGVTTLYKQRAEGKLEMGRIGRRVVIKASELERWFDTYYEPIRPSRAA